MRRDAARPQRRVGFLLRLNLSRLAYRKQCIYIYIHIYIYIYIISIYLYLYLYLYIGRCPTPTPLAPPTSPHSF